MVLRHHVEETLHEHLSRSRPASASRAQPRRALRFPAPSLSFYMPKSARSAVRAAQGLVAVCVGAAQEAGAAVCAGVLLRSNAPLMKYVGLSWPLFLQPFGSL